MNTFKLDAVFNLYTTVKKAELQQDGTIIAKDENDNVVNINMTNINSKATELENAKTNKKASGRQKLKDLGLDDDEIKALIGV